MATAAVGTEVGIYVDLVKRVHKGDAIVTTTGRCYMVASVREQTKGKHLGRQHLRVVVAEGDPPDGVVVHRIRWYRR